MSEQVRDWSAVMTRLEAVEERNRDLGRQNRLFRAVGALGVLVIGALLLTAAAVDQQAEVKAERFVLVDAQGNGRALLTTSANNGASALMLYDTKGNARLVLAVEGDEPCLQFLDKNGKTTYMVPPRQAPIETVKKEKDRGWGPEQAAGEPNTESAGDHQTAWASKTPDDQDEWLVLDYAEAVTPVAVKVYETYNPGAVSKVSVFDANGNEIEVWTGADPTLVDDDMGVSEIKLDTDVETTRVKLYLKSSEVEGWNEIDAVGLVDADGKTHWATAAAASSTYGQ